MWLVIGITVAMLLVVVLAAWRMSREAKPDGMKDLDRLINAKPRDVQRY